MVEKIKGMMATRGKAKVLGTGLLMLMAAVLIVCVPFSGDRRLMNIGLMALMYIALGQSWNIGAMAGLFSVSHSVFFGLGVYGISIMLNRFSGNVVTGVLMGLAANVLVATLVGVIASKLSDLYFIMALIGLSQTIYTLALQCSSLTGGSSGISLPREYLLPKPALYCIALGLAALSMIFYVFLRRSRLGTSFITTRENPQLASALGSNIGGWRIVATILSAVIASLCGAFYAFHLMSNNATVFSGDYSLKIMMVAIVGGIGSVWGPCLGVTMIVLDEFVRGAMPSKFAPFSVIIYALVLIVVALVRPGGLVSFFTGGKNKNVLASATNASAAK